MDGKLYGDIEPNLPVRLQTPVPGGVGLLTRLALLEYLMEIYNKKNQLTKINNILFSIFVKYL